MADANAEMIGEWTPPTDVRGMWYRLYREQGRGTDREPAESNPHDAHESARATVLEVAFVLPPAPLL